MFVLVKRTWGDFDMPFETPIAVSATKRVLVSHADALNRRRNPKEFKHGEWSHEFSVLIEQVTVL